LASQSYEQILQIQAFDLSIAQLRHRKEHHPTKARMAEIDAQLGEHDASVASVDEEKHDLRRQQKRLEDEVATVASRRKDIDAKLYGGEVTASKELLALQDEEASLLARQTAMEDDDLVIMEQIEEVDSKLAVFAEARAALEAERGAQESEFEAASVEIDTEIASTEAARAAAAGPANQELLASYETLRDQFDGVAVARLVGSSCDGCHMQLSAVAVDQIGKMPEDAVVTCEECGRLLVR
jgi:predicted  nucleic acid-binding Zn-ribbon protein